MKICLLTPRFPFPENGGDVLRINNIARYLKSQHHQLVLVSFAPSTEEVPAEAYQLYDAIYTVPRKNLVSLFFSAWFLLTRRPIQCGYYYSPSFFSLLKKVVAEERCDLYLSHLLRMTPYLEKLGLQAHSIVEMTDALSKTYQLSNELDGTSLKGFIYRIERKAIARYEDKVIQSFPKVILVSQADVTYLQNRNPKSKSLYFYTNGTSILPQRPISYQKNKICFVGNMRTLQNQDAVRFFMQDVFPLIQKEIPTAQFYVVGAQPSASLKSKADGKSIFVTGFVESVEAVIQDAALVVAPVRIAAGIQNKVLVAMGCAVPVVLTSLIAKAIPQLVSQQNCVIEDDPKKMAQQIIQIMQDGNKRTSLSEQAYQMVQSYYSWGSCLKGYEQL